MNDKIKVTKCVMESHQTSNGFVMEEDLMQGISQTKSIYRTDMIDYYVNVNTFVK